MACKHRGSADGYYLTFPVAQAVKTAGDLGSIPGSGRSPGEGNGYPLQYSLLENPMAEELGGLYSPWGHKESDMTG